MNEYFLTIYVMFCLGVGLRYAFEAESLIGRLFTLVLASLFAPLILGYDLARKLLSK